MNPDHAELISRSMDAWNRRDRPAAEACLHEDAEFHSAMTNVVGKTYRGRDAILSVWDEFDQQWASISWEVEEFLDAGDDRVVTLHRVAATGRESGIEVTRELGGVWEIRDGRIAGFWIYLDRDEALEAAGL